MSKKDRSSTSVLAGLGKSESSSSSNGTTEYSGSQSLGYTTSANPFGDSSGIIKGSLVSEIAAATPGAANIGNTASQTKDIAQNQLYGTPEQEELIGWQRGLSTPFLEGARSSDQQNANYAYYDWNLAKDNPRGNLNNRSFATTERFSRLADLLNNQVYFSPDMLSGTFNPGTGAVAEASSGQASINRWDPIETQEMRQMRANERLDEKARGEQVGLQARIQEYPQEMQEKLDQATMQLSDYIARTQDQYYNYLKQRHADTEYVATFNNYIQQYFQRFMTQMKAGTAEGTARFVMKNAPVIGNLVLPLMGANVPAPEIINRVQGLLFRLVENDPELKTMEDKFRAMHDMLQRLSFYIPQSYERAVYALSPWGVRWPTVSY